MQLNKTQLGMLRMLGAGEDKLEDIAIVLEKDKSQIYRNSKTLEKYGFLTLNRGVLKLSSKIHVNLLVNALLERKNLVDLLHDSAILILMELLTPKTVADIIEITHLKKSIVYSKIKSFEEVSIVKYENKRYFFNLKLWKNLKEFLIEYKRYSEVIDSRISPRAIIYFKDDKKIVFSTTSKEDGKLTGFSAYKDHGIDIMTIKNYYVLPDKNVTIKDVFIDSLYIAEKEKDYKNLIFIALFYLKNTREFSKIKNNILENIKKILKGEKIKGYPSYEEIKDRAEVYNIRL